MHNFSEMFLRARQALEFSYDQDLKWTLTMDYLTGSLGRGQRRSASGELATRMVAMAIAHELLRELLSIGTEESLRIRCHG